MGRWADGWMEGQTYTEQICRLVHQCVHLPAWRCRRRCGPAQMGQRSSNEARALPTTQHLAMSGKKDFDGIFLGTTNGPQAVGLFKLSAAGVGWKNQATGEITTIPAADIKELKWLRVARGHRLRIGHNNSSVYMFDGFSKEAYDHLVSIGKEFYGKALDPVDVSIKGYNWGTVDFQSSTLSFNVAKKLAFEVPLTQVANTAVGGKNEVSIEFAPTSAPSAPGRRAQEDTLVEIRFFVPGMVTAGQVDEDDEGRRQFKDKKEDGDDDTIELTDGREEGEIPHEAQQVVYGDDGEALTAAALFCETIKQKADMGTIQGEAIVSFSELLCVTPRGRFVVDMHETFLRLRGKSHDYKILYTSIKRMFLLPKPDDLHYVFVIGLDPPVRQGQTRYPYLVFQFGREDEIEIDLSLSNELLETKYAGRLQKSYDGPLYEVVSDVFKGLTGRNVTKESLQYRSAHGQTGLKASQKANEAILYPLDKSFLSIPKPPIFFAFSEIAAVTFARVSSGSSSSTKTFEVRFSLNSGVEYTFSSISR
ncbi:hypothetical protein BC831DRAFT_292356 [Entophlyctis helioformis]|nr:hypothetical protein BC831DRAFT_292356 [Entophlyctis helioformis]